MSASISIDASIDLHYCHYFCVVFTCLIVHMNLYVFINTGAGMEMHESEFPPAVGHRLPSFWVADGQTSDLSKRLPVIASF